ncbi:chemotaxis protein CheW [Thermosulfurimonas marina]|uniref:Chemotaxis protein CheW n=1 Tax=Thermosulfurimonas marina TaxID=2047767 RepID=A0A6H1WUI4_9BACT|nr:chemotaxis protein CheW [Thermosulfurimonas marina]QJA06814.1 chemotaxis protein CheW [Thermosulfurimonas marina]
MPYYFTFRKGERVYGLRVEEVEGVARLGEILPADWAPEWLLGFTFFRGQNVPVIDLERYLGEPSGEAPYLVVAVTPEGWLGFAASRLGATYESEEEPAPLDKPVQGLVGEILLGGHSVILLDPLEILRQGG